MLNARPAAGPVVGRRSGGAQDLHTAVRFLLHDLPLHVRTFRHARSRGLPRTSGSRFLPLGRQGPDPPPGDASLHRKIARHPVDPRRRAPTPDQWPSLLKRIRDGGKLCQVFISPEGALRIVREIGGKGFLFAINDYNAELKEPGLVEGWLKTLEKEDVPRRKTCF